MISGVAETEKVSKGAKGQEAHQHGDGRYHTHGVEQPHGPSEAGTVMIDIGPGVGAVVIRTTPAMNGQELEIRPMGGQWIGQHTAVRERRGGGSVQYAGVFGALPEGTYESRICRSEGPDPVTSFEVVSGTVTDVWWPAENVS
jgi:hypothetical protein